VDRWIRHVRSLTCPQWRERCGGGGELRHVKPQQIVGLGEEEKLKATAIEMLEARSEYILVMRKVDEEGNKSFVSLCHAPSMADIQFSE